MRGSIYGYVVRGDLGTPVAGARVTLMNPAGAVPGMRQLSVMSSSTNCAGWFAFDELPERDWLVRAVGPRGGRGQVKVPVFRNAVSEATITLNGLQQWLADTLASVDQSADAAPDDMRTDLGRPYMPGWSVNSAGAARRKEAVMRGSVRGRVVRAGSGIPVEDATIGILRGAGPAPDIAPLTDADGRFALDGLPPGLWVIAAVDADGRRGSTEFRVRAHAVTDVVIEIGP